MAKKKDKRQATFIDEQMDAFLERETERLERIGAVKVTWSKAQERGIWNMFAGLLTWAICDGVTVFRGAGWTAGMAQERRTEVVLERLVRVMRWAREFRDAEKEAVTTAEYKDAYQRFLWRKKRLTKSMTNWEALIMLSEASMEGPLSRDALAEMMRCFAHCYGLKKLAELCKDEGQYGPYIDLNAVQEFRFRKQTGRFPAIDDAEIAWIKWANRECKRINTPPELWPGLGLPVVVADQEPPVLGIPMQEVAQEIGNERQPTDPHHD